MGTEVPTCQGEGVPKSRRSKVGEALTTGSGSVSDGFHHFLVRTVLTSDLTFLSSFLCMATVVRPFPSVDLPVVHIVI